MTSLFGTGLPSPQQVRQNTATTLIGGASMFPNPGAAMIGAALGGGMSGLFSETRNPEVARAAKIQKLQQDWAKTWDINSITPATMPKVAAEMSRGLMQIGETELAMQLMSEANSMTKVSGDNQKQINTLRKDINAFTKDQKVIDSAYTKIKRVAKEKTATGDMSMVFGIMKLNDPNSTVREGEYATAKNAGGVSDRLRNLYNNAIDGQLLTPGQRKNFLATADNLYEAQRESTDRSIEQVLEFADEDKISRERVFGTQRYKKYIARQAKQEAPATNSNGLTPAEQQELEQLEKEFGTP